MKVLIILTVLELLLLGLIVNKLILVEDRLDQFAVQTTAHTDVLASRQQEKSPVSSSDYPQFDEDRLRRIIRSELHNAANLQLDAPNETTPQGLANPTEVDPIENIVRVELVKQRISDYVNLGAISDSEMFTLQQEISQLDPSSRRAMLRELTRALNSGNLDGRL